MGELYQLAKAVLSSGEAKHLLANGFREVAKVLNEEADKIDAEGDQQPGAPAGDTGGDSGTPSPVSNTSMFRSFGQ